MGAELGDGVPAAVRAALSDGAGDDGAGPALVHDLAAAVLRRLPAERLGAADPDAVATTVRDLLALVAPGPGPTTRIGQRPCTLVATDTPTTVVQLHGLDRPFLLATVVAAVVGLGHEVRRQLHPVLGVVRDDTGALRELVPARTAQRREALVHLELARLLDEREEERLRAALDAATADLVAATDDWTPMRRAVEELARRVDSGAATPRASQELRSEVAALLRWLDEGNMVLLGTEHYDVDDGRPTLHAGSGLGVLRRDGADGDAAAPTRVDRLPAATVERLLAPQVLRVTRTAEHARVQRHTGYDAVVVLERDPLDRVTGVTRVVGLFTRGAMAQPARTTPVLRRRLARLLEEQDVVAGSHDEGLLLEVFESLPRDELFAAEPDELQRMVVELVLARERGEVRVVVRRDQLAGSASVVAAVPRYRYDPAVRSAFSAHLQRVASGGDGAVPEVEVDAASADGQEVTVRFALRPLDASTELPPAAALGARLHELTRGWRDHVAEALAAELGSPAAGQLLDDVVDRFPAAYADHADVATVVDDAVAVRDQVHDLDLRVRPGVDGRGRVRVLVRGHSLVLSDFLPLLEDHGLQVHEEIPFGLADRPGEPTLHLHDFGVARLPEEFGDADAQRLADALRATWDRRTTSDSLHRLVVTAGLTWREAALLRAYRRYQRQVGTRYTPDYVNDALADNADVVRAVMGHVHARFDPARAADEATVAQARAAALAACDRVVRLDHDRILRGLVALVDATVRTNLYVKGADEVVLKLDPAGVPDVPAPVPHREIFVLGPRVEGIHLRGGPVARGGLRWSDRQDDVRTEVLGLMKAQMRKNAVIVPTGAKGGFVLRDAPSGREELRAAVEEQYRVFVRALLQVTDDLDGDDVVPPPGVRRWDGDDPYLVVAADKGTATFSDVANGIAQEQGFWLGDAFASGGSHGYDHKALGITARGAWVAVRRHLLELGIDPAQEPVDVAGVGDMSGDVFGNGLLSSRTLRLVAAFDHRHVFLDPDPDPAASFDERSRLFELPRSSWDDYDRALLSPGGMVVPREVKQVELTPQVRELLRLEDEAVPPAALLRAVLRAPVDLLWFGGVGTYVKDPEERHEDVGDRANDEVRVDADELRARVLGEGANLAITQRARIRYARRGGRADQDAVHNVGGVDCSDHEVNVKILLAAAVRDGALPADERDDLLQAVTDHVVQDVLRDVDLQVWRLSRDVAEAAGRTPDLVHLLGLLERDDGLDRGVEVLPDDEELGQRAEAGAGLTRPELATVVGWAKRRLTAQLLDGGLPDADTTQAALAAYFPPALRERFPAQLAEHRLRRELVATRVANEVVDRMGPTFASRVAEEGDVDEATVVAAWWAAREVARTDAAWQAVEGTLHVVGPTRQDAMAGEVEILLGALTRRYLDDPLVADPDALVARDRAAVGAYLDALHGLGTADQRRHRAQRAEALRDDLVDDALADALAGSRDAAMGPEVAATLRQLGWSPDGAPLVGDVLLHLSDGLGLARLHRVLDRARTHTVWRRRLRRRLAGDLRQLAAGASGRALREAGHDGAAPTGPVDGSAVAAAFLRSRDDRLARAERTVAAVERDEEAGLDGVTVALRALRDAVTTEPA